MSQKKIDILQRALKRERAARKSAEKILDEKSRHLYFLSEKLKKTNLKLETLLNEKSSQLQGVFKNFNDAYLVMDLLGNVLKMNDIAVDMFGYDFHKENFNVTSLIYPEDVKYAFDSFDTLKNEGLFTNFNSRIVTKLNEVKWVQINATIIYDKDNIPIAAQGIIRDITPDKKAEDLLIESKNRLSSLIMNLHSGVLLEDENRKVVLTNTKFLDLFKIPSTPEALIGLDCTLASEGSKILFKNPEGFVSRVHKILTDKKQVLGDELLMNDGRTVERDFIPVLKGDEYKGHLWTFRDITFRKQYSKILESQKQKYSNIIANMNLGLLEVNNDDKVLMINQSFSDMSGYTESELLGKKASHIFLSKNDSSIIEEQTNNRFKGISGSYELKIKNKQGVHKTWLVSGAPNLDLNGDIIGSIGIHLDVSDSKRNIELIQEQKNELDIIINNAPVGILLMQSENIVKTNATFQNMLGFSEIELQDFTIQNILLPEDYKENKVGFHQIKHGEIDNFSFNKRYRKKDGSVIWAKTNINSVRDKEGKIKYQVVLVEDITSDREKTLILDMVNNLTKSILGITDVYQIAWEIVNNIAEYLDSKDCIIYLVDHKQNTMEQIAVYGEKLDDNNKIKNRLTVKIGDGIVGTVAKTAKSEIVNDTSKDKRYIVDDQVRLSEITVPILSQGKLIGVIDSEHKDKNYFTQEHVKTLESIASLVGIKLQTALNIREREKAEAKNTQLLQELEISNNELQEYAHVVSHDLKTPLRSIDALVSWIKTDNKDNFDTITLQNLELIEITLETMEQLISNVLEYSSAGFNTEKISEIDLNLILEDVKKILYIPKNTTINILKKLPILKGEKTKFQQLFLNLISNAIKFGNNENNIIEIDVIEKEKFYQFSINDNGIGIDKKFHDRIFKVFHFLNKSDKSTGIGLSIVKKIVNLYHGDIWIESELGKGTIFYFTIKK
ncbi:MAG: PAS domain-containing sensor histidine kinase [Flavobacteriales bacterium]